MAAEESDEKKISIVLRDDFTDTYDPIPEMLSIRELIQFLEDEIAFWEKARTEQDAANVENGWNGVNAYLNGRSVGVMRDFVQWVAGVMGSDSSWPTTHNLNHELNVRLMSSMVNQWMWSGREFTGRYQTVHLEKGNVAADGFVSYLKGTGISNFQDPSCVYGVLAAHHYLNRGICAKDAKAESEEGETRLERIQRRSSEAQADVEVLEKKAKDLYESMEENWRDWFTGIKTHQKAHEEKDRKEFDEQTGEWHATINRIENTYQEQLRLAKPAEYWAKTAANQKARGDTWMVIVVLYLFAGCIGLYYLFDHWLQGQAVGIDLSTLQGAALFGSLAAVYLLGIRFFSRMVFSSYHLQRDAEEREQLTYLYLSLTNETDDFDQGSREIVLSALFSRSETGLIANETGPTMPMAEIIKSIKNAS